MKTLIIAEKPSVAKDIVTALGNFSQPSREFFERDDTIVSSAVGHVATLDVPEARTFPPLPIIPQKFAIVPIEQAKSRLFMLVELIKRKEVTRIVNACDAGREGELIFHLIYAYAGIEKPVFRMWMQSMTVDSIRSAHRDMQPASRYAGLLDAALCRAEADWLVGINGSRALSKLLRKTTGNTQVSSLGRVQTPTLALVVHRELEIKHFVPEDYFEIHGTFNAIAGQYSGKWQGAENGENDKGSRFKTRAEAQAIADRCSAGHVVEVSEESKPSHRSAPGLFDLTTLQREANKVFGFTATETLKIAQALYETHKAISYPRTDSSALPADYVETVTKIIESFSGTDFSVYTMAVLENNWIAPGNKKIFNDSKISDHFAIIPTGQQPGNLNDAESKIYNMIARRFIAAFYPPAEYLKTNRISRLGLDCFHSTGSVLKSAGWLHVYGSLADPEGESSLIAVEPGEQVKLQGIEVKSLKTRPPAFYTEASLLGAMEKASGEITDDDEAKKAMSEKGLGTPATRAAIIEGLVGKEYIKRADKQIRPTDRALNLIPFLEKMGLSLLTSAKTTGEWEHRLALMDKGGYSRELFMQEIEETTRVITSVFAGHEANARAAHVCPECGQPLLRRQSKQKKGQFYWACSSYPDCKTIFSDAKGLPGEKKVAPIPSTEHFCSECGKGLVLRTGISKKTARPYRIWACSGYPTCKAPPLNDKDGKPTLETGNTPSTEHLCSECGAGLIFRSGLSKKTGKPYKMWACSNHKKCKAKPLSDVNGKPVLPGSLN